MQAVYFSLSSGTKMQVLPAAGRWSVLHFASLMWLICTQVSSFTCCLTTEHC